MARSAEEIRRDLEAERAQLASSVNDLRAAIAQAADVKGKLRAKLPVVAAAALGTGFFLGGGIGATMRLLARRSREGTVEARVGRFRFVDRG
jgi:predicted ATPase with chaperone activity